VDDYAKAVFIELSSMLFLPRWIGGRQQFSCPCSRRSIVHWNPPGRKTDGETSSVYRHPGGLETTWLEVDEQIGRINAKLRGWSNYFRIETVKQAYRSIDTHVRRVRQWLRTKFKVKDSGKKKYPAFLSPHRPESDLRWRTNWRALRKTPSMA
jgi:hypothetical protein